MSQQLFPDWHLDGPEWKEWMNFDYYILARPLGGGPNRACLLLVPQPFLSWSDWITSESMEMDWNILFSEEHARGIWEGLCLYCGCSRYLQSSCPRRPGPQSQLGSISAHDIDITYLIKNHIGDTRATLRQLLDRRFWGRWTHHCSLSCAPLSGSRGQALANLRSPG